METAALTPAKAAGREAAAADGGNRDLETKPKPAMASGDPDRTAKGSTAGAKAILAAPHQAIIPLRLMVTRGSSSAETTLALANKQMSQSLSRRRN